MPTLSSRARPSGKAAPARSLAAAVLAVLTASCGSPADPAPEPTIPLPAGAQVGDEIVASIEAGDIAGSFADDTNPGLLLELTLGGNLPRHAVLPGGLRPRLRVSLGAWDGGPLRSTRLAGEGQASVTAEIDPAAAGVPIMGLYDDRFFNDVPLGLYVEGSTFTYILSNEDAGTGLFPTLLMAQYGRPNDIEGLYETAPEPTIQAEGHTWIPFDGPYEGSHPRLRIATLNGLVAPDADPPAVYRVSPMPLDFTTGGGAVPRERVLDQEPWMLAASFDEIKRQGQFAEDGGPSDAHIGHPEDYIFIDYQFESDSGAVLAFEAQVDGAWLSSLGLWTSQGGLADAHASGLGRTCIELPPGRSAADITALRAVASGSGSGTLTSARWFRYADAVSPIEMGTLAAPTPIAAGADAPLDSKAQSP